MPKVILGGKELEIDEDGFIQEPEKWDKAVAEDIARTEEAYPMSDDHWKLVNYLRNYFLEFEIAPPVRICNGNVPSAGCPTLIGNLEITGYLTRRHYRNIRSRNGTFRVCEDHCSAGLEVGSCQI